MAEIAKGGTPSISSVDYPMSNNLTGQAAGEDLAEWDAIYLKNDGKWYRATGAAANAAAVVGGYCPGAHSAGDTDVTVYFGGCNVSYSTGLTPGAGLYLSGVTPGGLADAASPGGTRKLAMVLGDGARVRFFPIA